MSLRRIEHIAVLVNDVDKSSEILKEILKIKNVPMIEWTVTKDLDGTPKEPYTLKVAFFKLENTILELMQVVAGKSFYEKFKDKIGQGIHHVCFDVEDIKEEISKLDKVGIQVVESGIFAGSSFAYLDTEETCGFLIELFQKRTRSKRKHKK
ncbi:MAG: VOC family protein [Candidatus Helarchaeota archaeon]